MRADIERRLKALELDAKARKATTEAISRIDVTQHEAPIYRAVHDAIEAREYRRGRQYPASFSIHPLSSAA